MFNSQHNNIDCTIEYDALVYTAECFTTIHTIQKIGLREKRKIVLLFSLSLFILVIFTRSLLLINSNNNNNNNNNSEILLGAIIHRPDAPKYKVNVVSTINSHITNYKARFLCYISHTKV